MGVRHLHYLQLSPELRKSAARSARERMTNLVNMNPFLTQDQMIGVQKQLAQLADWENGCMDEGGAPPAPAPLKMARAPLPLPAPAAAPLLAHAEISASAEVKAPSPPPPAAEGEGDRETPIVDMRHLAAMIKKPPPGAGH